MDLMPTAIKELNLLLKVVKSVIFPEPLRTQEDPSFSIVLGKRTN